jgi:hypothetical protein
MGKVRTSPRDESSCAQITSQSSEAGSPRSKRQSSLDINNLQASSSYRPLVAKIMHRNHQVCTDILRMADGSMHIGAIRAPLW